MRKGQMRKLHHFMSKVVERLFPRTLRLNSSVTTENTNVK